MHHNSQKRLQIPGQTYFLTAKTHQNFPYFREEIFCELFVAELEICKELKKFELFAFCLNWDHFHLLIKPSAEFDISKIMHFLKRHFSRDANFILNATNEGDIRECRLQNHDDNLLKSTIKNHDQFVKNLKKQFLRKNNPHEFPQFKWQKSFHDHAIRDEKDLENHFNYTVNNFRKHDLPENWKWNSGNFEEMIDGVI
jgi:REP element-mobilizing transposase RayT